MIMNIIGSYENAYFLMTSMKDSQLFLESKKQHIKLAPKYIGNLRKGVSEHLSCVLSRYCNEFDGVPVAYKNVKVLQNLGRVISDQSCIHLDVEAHFIIFKPTVGCTLTGVINKVSKRHIGCLVHGVFNAWVPQVIATERTVLDKLLGTKMQFLVQAIFTNNNVISLKGKFQCLLEKNCESVGNIYKGNSKRTLLDDDDGDDDEVKDDSPPIKKTKLDNRSDINILNTGENENISVTNHSNQVEMVSPSKSHKKHKHKRKSARGNDIEDKDIDTTEQS